MSGSPQPSTSNVGGRRHYDDDDDELFQESVRQYVSTMMKHLRIPRNFRVWETVDRPCCIGGFQPFQFKIMSYNVLAQYLLESNLLLYMQCGSHDLEWEVRAKRLYEEIINELPDILCLQELQTSHFERFYLRFVEKDYLGVFKRKTGQGYDGCAIFYKTTVFELKDYHSVEFHQPHIQDLNEDNIGLMAKFTPLNEPQSAVVVATTQLVCDSTRTQARLAQMRVFLAEIDRFSYYDNGHTSGHLPIILTGNFSSTPDTALIRFLDGVVINASSYQNQSDWQSIGVTDDSQHLSMYLNRREGRPTPFTETNLYHSEIYAAGYRMPYVERHPHSFMFSGNYLSHSFRLLSIYDRFKAEGREVTTGQNWVTVDYMYFNCRSPLKLVERLRLPTAVECEVLGQLPDHVYASDHLALAAKFELPSPSYIAFHTPWCTK